MDNGDMMGLIKARFDIARINRERFVFFTPHEREQVMDWLNQQQEEIERLQPKKGKWLEYAGDQKCSVCGSSYSDLYPEYDRTPFCPHCGAKMESGDGKRSDGDADGATPLPG